MATAKASLAILIIISVSTLWGCTRPTLDRSNVIIKTPVLGGSESSLENALPANKKACYAINVNAADITSAPVGPVGCGLRLGQASGFVPEGAELTVEVTKGQNRNFELLVYLAEASEACPSLGSETFSVSNTNKIYMSGKAQNVNIANDAEVVKIALDFPGESQSIASVLSCSAGASGLKAKLLSNGDLHSPTDTLLAGSSAINEGMYQTPIVDTLGIGLITSGGVVNIASSNVIAPSWVYSVTRKPDSGIFFALKHDGKIVQLQPSSGQFLEVSLDSSNCPFDVTDCRVPVWMQSISAGYGKDIFALDHSGQIHKMTLTGPVSTGLNVGPTVTQVSYY